MSNASFGTYEDVAAEYYDPIRHPTCANFREASFQLLSGWLRKICVGENWLCEVAPGKSLVAEVLAARKVSLGSLIFLDSSPTMLAYSKQWASAGAHLILAAAFMLPLSSGSMDLVVSSVGDPYNRPHFWDEVYRVLRPGGISLFTSPSYEWAAVFRAGVSRDMKMKAEFQLANGRRVYVPSWVYPKDEQIEMFKHSGLLVKEIADIPLSALKSKHIAPKLLVGRGSEASVLTGYVLLKA